ncbi:MAG: di-heme oxidoredictase family protein [Planctomycetota bacterium]
MRMRVRLLVAMTLAVAGLVGAGLLPPNSPIPEPGEAGAPHTALDAEEQAAFLRGRALFDKDFLMKDGVGPVFNGDSCRACHQDPVIGGAGGIDVQVQRPQMPDGSAPGATGALAQTHSRLGFPREEIPTTVAFVEERNSPTTLGLGLVETISDETIMAGAAGGNPDKIPGMVHVLGDGSIGRLGWKAQVPDLESFVRDALGNEMGITVPDNGNPFGFISDGDGDGDDADDDVDDGVEDPEIPQTDIDDLVFFLRMLDFPPKLPDTQQILDGQALFSSVGCAKCHTPVMDGVELYSDLLLHDVQPDGFVGVTQGLATSGLYRTAPLRGLRDTAPYFHDGRSQTVRAAIRRHDGTAAEVTDAYEALSDTDRDALLAFLLSR